MTRALFRLASIWTAVGLLMGLYYRTITHMNDFTGKTQLSIVHTHTLALGMLMMLILTGLVAVFNVRDEMFRWGIWVYTAALAVTTGTMAVRGTMQVLDLGDPHNAALNGVSGLGHIGLTVALVMILMSLGKAVKTHAEATA